MHPYLVLTLMLFCATFALTLQVDQGRIDSEKIQRDIERKATADKMRREAKQCWNGTYLNPPDECPPTPAQREAWATASRENNKAFERMVLQRRCEEVFDAPGIDFETRKAAEGLFPWALAKVAIAAHKVGRLDAAKACLTTALTKGAVSALEISSVADGYRAIEDYPEAIRLYVRSLKENGIEVNCVAATRAGGRLLATATDLARVRADVEAARENLRVLSLGIGGRRPVGEVLAAQARLTKAESELKALACRYSAAEVASLQASQSARYNRLADHRASLGIAESLLALRQVEDATAWGLRARSLEGKLESKLSPAPQPTATTSHSRPAPVRSVNAPSGAAEAQFRHGEARLAKFGHPGALPFYQEAVRLAPKYAPYRDRLGFALHVAGRPAEAVPHLLKATELDPGNWLYFLHLAEAQTASGNPQAAAQTINKAFRLRPGEPLARGYLEGAQRRAQQAMDTRVSSH